MCPEPIQEQPLQPNNEPGNVSQPDPESEAWFASEPTLETAETPEEHNPFSTTPDSTTDADAPGMGVVGQQLAETAPESDQTPTEESRIISEESTEETPQYLLNPARPSPPPPPPISYPDQFPQAPHAIETAEKLPFPELSTPAEKLGQQLADLLFQKLGTSLTPEAFPDLTGDKLDQFNDMHAVACDVLTIAVNSQKLVLHEMARGDIGFAPGEIPEDVKKLSEKARIAAENVVAKKLESIAELSGDEPQNYEFAEEALELLGPHYNKPDTPLIKTSQGFHELMKYAKLDDRSKNFFASNPLTPGRLF